MTTTFLYGTQFKVILKAGRVIESNCESYPVGIPMTMKQLRACGWKAPKKVVQYDVWGRKIN